MSPWLCQARFFHPSAKIREKWPNDHKRMRLKRVFVTGKEMFRISRRYQLAYKCRISEIDDGSEFHICANNFRVDQDPVLPFEYESMTPPCTHPAAEPDLNKEASGSNENASNGSTGSWSTRKLSALMWNSLPLSISEMQHLYAN